MGNVFTEKKKRQIARRRERERQEVAEKLRACGFNVTVMASKDIGPIAIGPSRIIRVEAQEDIEERRAFAQLSSDIAALQRERERALF